MGSLCHAPEAVYCKYIDHRCFLDGLLATHLAERFVGRPARVVER